jgi:hypothetical protein
MLVFMGPVNQCTLSSTDVWLKSTTSMAVRGEKLGGDLRIDQSMDWGCSRGSLFLGNNEISTTLWSQRERLSRTRTARRKHTSGVCGLAWEVYVSCVSDFPLQGVHRFKLPRLSDISNRLSCGCHQVVIYWINN